VILWILMWMEWISLLMEMDIDIDREDMDIAEYRI
jgi:hypothetical protein